MSDPLEVMRDVLEHTQVSQYARILNALDKMQQSRVYAARRHVLVEAECLILRLERRVEELEYILRQGRGNASEVQP